MRVARSVQVKAVLAVALIGSFAAWMWALPALLGPVLPPWLPWVGFVGLAMGAYLAWALHAVRRWKHLAWAGGFAPHGDPSTPGFWLGMPDLRRAEGDREVVVRTYATGSDHETRWTAVEASVAEDPPGPDGPADPDGPGPPAWADYELTVELEDGFGLFGGDRDVEVGEEGFDEAFEVTTSDEAATARILDGAARDLLADARPFGRLTVEDGTVRHAVDLLVLDADEVEAQVRAVVHVARRVEHVLGREDDADEDWW